MGPEVIHAPWCTMPKLTHEPGTVRVLNYCSDARSAFNGSLCVMSPWEGIWVFRGASGGGNIFGLPHGKVGAS